MKDKTFFLTSFYLVDEATNQNFTIAPSAGMNFLRKEKKNGILRRTAARVQKRGKD